MGEKKYGPGLGTGIKPPREKGWCGTNSSQLSLYQKMHLG